MGQPLVSIIMSTYDEPYDVVKKSITSILNQTHKNLELVICIDNPNNKELIQSLNTPQHDSRIKVIVNEVNIGLGFSLNRCIDEAKGEYIARMDADDISHPERLEKQLLRIARESPNTILFTEVLMMNKDGKEVSREFPKDPSFEKNFFPDDAFVHATLLTRKELISKYKYRISHSPEDYEMYFRMRHDNCEFKLLNEKLYTYNFNIKTSWRGHSERRSRTFKTAKIMLSLLSRHFSTLRQCNGFARSYFKYIVMLILASNKASYTLATLLYSGIRNK